MKYGTKNSRKPSRDIRKCPDECPWPCPMAEINGCKEPKPSLRNVRPDWLSKRLAAAEPEIAREHAKRPYSIYTFGTDPE
jgi:hypothetical protein